MWCMWHGRSLFERQTVPCFGCRGKRRGNSKKRGGVGVGVGGGGGGAGREPHNRYRDCLILSASVNVLSVTAAWRWQACREARGPCVAPRVTLLVNTFAPGTLSCLITTIARVVYLLNARVAPVAQDNFTDISAFILELHLKTLNIHLLGERLSVQST